MLNDIHEFLKTIKIENLMKNDEATLKQTVILRLFSLLGWDIFNSKEIIPEFSIGGKKVDYALCDEGKPKVFVEVKKSGEDLSNHQEQLLNYSFKQGIRLSVLTNGTTWWFYLPLQEASWEERKFDSLDISREDLTKFTKKIVSYLNKDDVISNKAVEVASHTYRELSKKRILDDAFPRAWSLVVNADNADFIEILNKNIEEISGYRTSKDNIEVYIRNQIRRPSIAIPDSSLKVKRRISDKKVSGMNHWLIPFRDPDALQRLIVDEKIWAFGENTPGRKSLKPGDWVCFYLSKKGIVAHGQVASKPTYQKHPKVREPENYPWVFNLFNIKDYPESPVRLDENLRRSLEKFENKDFKSTWGWFVQSTTKISETDFNKLIRR